MAKSVLSEVALVIVLALMQQSMGAPVWASWGIAWIYARLAMERRHGSRR